ncbi:MAG: CAP domain-containing protein, partial [Clostridia bacterium]|nr:CAP domain-containing protein [Clostridia bacterium]
VTAHPTAEPVPTVTIGIFTPSPNITKRPATVVGSFQSGLAAQVVNQVNAERSKYGLSMLRMDSELTRAAQVRAEEIVRKFSHTRPDGSKWSTVSASAYGENIAKGQKTADKVMAAWLTSEGHRANILKAGFGSIGVCAYVSGGITYWVQLFGK